MIKYLKNIVYFFLCVVDDLINFLCSLVHTYPKSEISTNFLVFLEMRRVGKEMDIRLTNRGDKLVRADELVKRAKDLDNNE